MNDVKITRLRSTDKDGGMREIHVDLEDIAGLLPGEMKLQPGDIIQVPKSGWSSFRETFNIVIGAAIITTAVANVIIATKR